MRLLLFILLLLLNPAALAQDNLSYTTLYQKKPSSKPTLHIKTFNTKKEAQDTPEIDEDVWKKYQELAGETEIEPQAPAGKETNLPSKPKSGFAGIMEQHRESRAQKGQMRSLTISKPQKPPEP